MLLARFGGVRGAFTWVDQSGDGMSTTWRRTVISLALLAALSIVGPVQRSEAGSAAEIDSGVEATLKQFFWQVRGARELVAKSAAVLVFPSVIKAGMGIGGEYGEGALLARGRTLEYYNTVFCCRSRPREWRDRRVRAFLAARSGWSGGFDALVPTPATQLQRYLNSRNTRGDRGRRSGEELGKAAQVLGDGRQRELELGSARAAQPKPAEPEDALEVGEQHLDALALTAGLLEGLCPGERSRHVAGVLVDIPQDATRGHVGAALGFERAGSTFANQCM